MNTKLFRSAVAAAAVLLCSVGLVSAGTEIFDDTASACTGINCSSLRIPGSILNHVGISPKPWVAQLFKGGLLGVPGEDDCMRLDVVSQGANLEIVAISPSGTVYRNDNRAPGDLRPLVIIPAGSQHGWFTVHVGVFNGAAVEDNFVLLYGRYNANTNPNCASPTPPSALADEEEDEE